MSEAIVGMRPGERPTEPGWYIIDAPDGREICEVIDHQGQLAAVVRGDDRIFQVEAIARHATFIARIYPELVAGNLRDV